MTKIQLWQNSVTETVIAARKSQRLLKEAEEDFTLPTELRPATAEDIFPGNIFWYPAIQTSNTFWRVVDHTLYGDANKFKAYEAHDGCRYGLENAYVEITNESN